MVDWFVIFPTTESGLAEESVVLVEGNLRIRAPASGPPVVVSLRGRAYQATGLRIQRPDLSEIPASQKARTWEDPMSFFLLFFVGKTPFIYTFICIYIYINSGG